MALRLFAVCVSTAVLGLAGCDAASYSESEVADEGGTARTVANAVSAIGNEPYKWVPHKKTAAADQVGPATVVPGHDRDRIQAPADAKRPEIVAHVKQFSDGSRQFNGPYAEFSSDGTAKHVEGNFRDDRRDGAWVYYHPNGQVAKEVNYADGKLDGAWTLFNEDGTKRFDVSYKNGMRDGPWAYYGKADAEGKQHVAKTEQWKQGQLDGQFVQFHATGEKARELTFKASKIEGKETVWYPSGKVYSEAHYENGMPHGKLTIWDESGKVVLEREYREGKPLGTSTPAKDAASSK